MKSKKIYISIVSILMLAVAITLGFYFGVYGVNNNNNNSGFDNKIDTEVNDIVAIDRLGNPIAADSTIPMQSFAYTCASTNSNRTVSLSVVVKPENTTDKTIEWSLGWENKGSAFANGKNVLEYVAYTVSQDTSTIELEYKQAFGEKIIVTAKVQKDQNVSAKCTIDCCKKYKYKNYEYDYNTLKVNLTTNSVYTIDYTPDINTVTVDAKFLVMGNMSEMMLGSGIEDDMIVGYLPVEFKYENGALIATLNYKDAIKARYAKNGRTYDQLLQSLADNGYKAGIILGQLTGTVNTEYYSFSFKTPVIDVPYETWRIPASSISFNKPSIKL